MYVRPLSKTEKGKDADPRLGHSPSVLCTLIYSLDQSNTSCQLTHQETPTGETSFIVAFEKWPVTEAAFIRERFKLQLFSPRPADTSHIHLQTQLLTHIIPASVFRAFTSQHIAGVFRPARAKRFLIDQWRPQTESSVRCQSPSLPRLRVVCAVTAEGRTTHRDRFLGRNSDTEVCQTRCWVICGVV